MKYCQRVISLAVTLSALYMFTFSGVATAEAAGIAAIKAVVGQVDIMRVGKLPAIPAVVDAPLAKGDFVRTKSSSYAEIVYSDGTILKIAQRSRVDIGEQAGLVKSSEANVKLVRGKVQAVVTPAQDNLPGVKRFEIHTPNAVAGVRGTDFIVSFHRDVTSILVTSGNVYTYNPAIPDRVVNLPPSTITTVTSAAPPLPARVATRSEIERIERGILPPNQVKANDLSKGEGTQPASTSGSQTGGTSSTQPSQVSADIVPTDTPIITAPANQGLNGDGATQPSVPVKTPSTLSPLITEPLLPPPPPPPPPLSPSTNVNIDIKF